MTLSKLKFISRVLETHRTSYCDNNTFNCSCESCGDNFTIEQAQRYIQNEIEMLIEEKQWEAIK